MKTETKANGNLYGLGDHPAALAGAGDLAATLWGTGELCRIIICRIDQISGKADQALFPNDIVDLAKLTCVLADILSTFADLDSDLRETLACLSASIGDVLGVECTSGFVPDAFRRAVGRVLEYSLEDEGIHFRDNPGEDHVYRSLLLLALWIEDGIASRDCVLSPLSPNGHGVCPICGSDDEFVDFRRTHWHLCHRHRVRWSCSVNPHSDLRSEPEEDWRSNWERICHYREVVPFVTGSLSSPCN